MASANETLGAARILILEDDYMLATDLQMALEDAGATVIGPFADEGSAIEALIEASPDFAFVDVNTGDRPSFAVPRALASGAVPFVFVTGYDADMIPAEFKEVIRLEKPVETRKALQMVAQLLERG